MGNIFCKLNVITCPAPTTESHRLATSKYQFLVYSSLLVHNLRLSLLFSTSSRMLTVSRLYPLFQLVPKCFTEEIGLKQMTSKRAWGTPSRHSVENLLCVTGSYSCPVLMCSCTVIRMRMNYSLSTGKILRGISLNGVVMVSGPTAL